MRKIAVVSVARSDYGIYRPVLRELSRRKSIQPVVIAAAAHLSKDFGNTVEAIEADGFEVAGRVAMTLPIDSPVAITESMGLGITGFGQVYHKLKPDLLLVLGDRYEMMSAALSALSFRIPVAHCHGGELTFGAIDEQLRHCITKLSHIHFVATPEYGKRVEQLGEAPWRIHVTGAPGIDAIREAKLLTREEFKSQYDFELPERYILAIFHPATLSSGSAEKEAETFFQAMSETGLPAVISMPNADTGSRASREVIARWVESKDNWIAFENLRSDAFLMVLQNANVMAGNSSSGILEAASYKIPVVNVGPRQEGRIRAKNVVDVPCVLDNIKEGFQKALSQDFRGSLKNCVNPYGDGHASTRIADVLESITIDKRLIVKEFHDINQ